MKNLLAAVGLSLFLMSCGSQNKVRNSDLIQVDTTLCQTFHNNDSQKKYQTLTSLFGMQFQKDNQAEVRFDKDGDLKISYKDDKGILRYQCFKGRIKKKYFEIFFEKYRKDIPLIYGKTQIHRIRVKLTKDSTLIVQRYFNRSGHVFLMAAGSSSKEQYQFKPINNK